MYCDILANHSGLVAMSAKPLAQVPGIAHIITSLTTGGAEIMLWKVGDALVGRGWQQQVVALRAGPVAARLEASGIPVTSLGLSPFNVWWKHRQLRQAIASGPSDVLQGWMYHGNLAALASRHAGGRSRPVIWGVRQSLYALHRERPLTSALIRLGARLSPQVDAIVYNSHVSKSQHERLGYHSSRAVVVPNGFDVKVFHPDRAARAAWRARHGWSMDAVVVLMLARWHPMKNHAGFLRAIAPLVRARPELHVVLAGRDVDLSNRPLRSLALQLGLADRFVLLGEVSETPDLLAASDVLCSASLWGEGFPNAVGEAMACGVPCVVTNVGDSSWVVGEAGIVVAPDEAALREGLGVMLAFSHEERSRLGAQARRRIIEHFSLASVAAAYEDIYRDAARWHTHC